MSTLGEDVLLCRSGQFQEKTAAKELENEELLKPQYVVKNFRYSEERTRGAKGMLLCPMSALRGSNPDLMNSNVAYLSAATTLDSKKEDHISETAGE